LSKADMMTSLQTGNSRKCFGSRNRFFHARIVPVHRLSVGQFNSVRAALVVPQQNYKVRLSHNGYPPTAGYTAVSFTWTMPPFTLL
jgi:hypothetical protein